MSGLSHAGEQQLTPRRVTTRATRWSRGNAAKKRGAKARAHRTRAVGVRASLETSMTWAGVAHLSPSSPRSSEGIRASYTMTAFGPRCQQRRSDLLAVPLARVIDAFIPGNQQPSLNESGCDAVLYSALEF